MFDFPPQVFNDSERSLAQAETNVSAAYDEAKASFTEIEKAHNDSRELQADVSSAQGKKEHKASVREVTPTHTRPGAPQCFTERTSRVGDWWGDNHLKYVNGREPI